ncbi:MAG: glycerol-3-phosphate dehydrogenase (NAD(P)+) [Halocynthiibacter sp.]|jgi:glycerol-3-phosphate dehydrogenase (NAD(P)+)
MSDVGVLGGGAFGTALALSLARDGRAVQIWARNPEHAKQMHSERENKARLAGFAFPENLDVTSDLADLSATTLLLAVPVQSIGAFLKENATLFRGKTLISASKGIDLSTGRGPVDLIMDHGIKAAVISGPSFAVDIAAGLPTAMTLAAEDEASAGALQEQLSTDALRIYRSTDRAGVALGGALKNVMALAAGMAIGAGLGESARAALLTRGYAEMARFAVAHGAEAETMAGLAGFGDLVLSCTSAKSRNYSYGLGLAQASALPTATVEGVVTAKAVSNIAKKLEIEMPIARAVAAVLDQKLTIPEAMEALLSRPLTKE